MLSWTRQNRNREPVKHTTTRESAMIVALNQKSGKGLSDGVVSELTTIFTVRPGHAEQLRAACTRFMDVIRDADKQARQRTGLRDVRFVLFDDDRRFMVAPSF